jgi:exosortase/archaeosortase family protein
VLRFVAAVGVALAAYHAAMTTQWFKVFFANYMAVNAHVSAGLLRMVGEEVFASGVVLRGDRFAVSIHRGCEALEPTVLFAAAALSAPFPWRMRVAGVLSGILALGALNLVRIVSLYYVGARWPAAFQTLHVDFWPVAFIAVTLMLWLAWAVWAVRSRTQTAGGRAEARADV